MKNTKLYIKIEQNTELTRSKIYLKDIAVLYCVDTKVLQKVKAIHVIDIKEQKNKKIMFSIMKIIEQIEENVPEVDVVNLGETDFIISYTPEGKKRPIWEWCKVIVACLIIGVGSAFSIMTFDTDVSVADVFAKSYNIFLGEGAKSNGIVELAYSIGLPIGILVFFNHFSKRASLNDPTPLQVEMRNYEEEENKALIKDASREGTMIDVD